MVNKCFGIKEAKVLQENYCCSHMVIVLVCKHHYMSIYYLLQLLISTASFKMVCVCVCVCVYAKYTPLHNPSIYCYSTVQLKIVV